MPDEKSKRTFEQDTLIIPGLRLEPVDPAQPRSEPAEKRSSRHADQSLQDREKLVSKLIEHLKGL